jgi:hypothetical protein
VQVKAYQIEAQHLSDLHEGTFEFCCVVAGLEAFALGQYAEHCWIGVGHPTTENEATEKNYNASK